MAKENLKYTYQNGVYFTRSLGLFIENITNSDIFDERKFEIYNSKGCLFYPKFGSFSKSITNSNIFDKIDKM